MRYPILRTFGAITFNSPAGLSFAHTPSAGEPCGPQDDLAPRVTTVYGVPVPEKAVALRAVDGAVPTLSWRMVDRSGAPVDLTGCDVSFTPAVVLRLREATWTSPTVYEAAGAVTDVATGAVSAVVDTTALGGPGVYLAEFAVLDAPGGGPLFTNQFFLTVDRGLFGMGPQGPPTLAEIRLHLRDSSPAENLLIDTITFDDAEIAACIAHPVNFWNGALPPVAPFTTSNFPFRYWWLEATKACLFRIAAEYYRKNHLQYQAGGVAVDDLNKAQEYDLAADKIWAEYKPWVQSRKVAINISEGYGELGSAYGALSGYSDSHWGI